MIAKRMLQKAAENITTDVISVFILWDDKNDNDEFIKNKNYIATYM